MGPRIYGSIRRMHGIRAPLNPTLSVEVGEARLRHITVVIAEKTLIETNSKTLGLNTEFRKT